MGFYIVFFVLKKKEIKQVSYTFRNSPSAQHWLLYETGAAAVARMDDRVSERHLFKRSAEMTGTSGPRPQRKVGAFRFDSMVIKCFPSGTRHSFSIPGRK